MSTRHIQIKGKMVSEDTIVEALKAHCGFAEEYTFKMGDVVELRPSGEKRLILKTDDVERG
jgi:hypothetical protein